MSSKGSFLKWAIPLAILTIQISPSFAQIDNSCTSGCPVGGYAITACPVRTDAVVREAIMNRLSGTVTPRATYISVRVRNGIVTLTGAVDSIQTKQLATMLASQVSGAACIQNYLAVSPTASEDLNLIRDIRNALTRYPGNFRQVVVDVNEGIAELRGSVENEVDREQAAMVAASVPGVSAVHNNLSVFSQTGTW